jgi:acyl-CoA reductase-like NAD-dependent aldehyde dehydrogenase
VSLTTASDQITTELFIGGEPRQVDERLDVHDPASPSTLVGTAAAASKQDAIAAVAAAKQAFPAWSALSAAERAAQIGAAIEGLEATRDEDARVLTLENGKPFQESWIDILVLSVRTGLALELADQVEAVEELPGPPADTAITYQPLGVVTIIVPFNWPLAILGASLPHALLAGNTVVVKPPPSTPLAMTRVVSRMAAKLPPGVLNVVTGRDEEMSPLIQNADVAKVCFTGSVGGGKKIMELAAPTLTRVTLELGGNDPAVILDDADLDDAALDRLYAGIFTTAGQICMNAKRIYVHRSRYDEVVEALSRRLEQAEIGHGLTESTTIGPLNQRRQKEFVESLVQEAKDADADVREFGEIPAELSDGNFVRPAIVLDPDPSLRVVTEEQFGPVIPIIPFDDEDKGVADADDTWSGLCGSVWSSDPKRVDSVANRLTCGFVFVNDHGPTRLDLRAPFGGMRHSGFGREQGLHGIRAFQDTRSVSRAYFDEAPSH